MNKRLVWNFEIRNDLPLDLSRFPNEEPEQFRWEARYFWEEDAIITLNGLNDNYLNLALYEVKQRHDLYYILQNHDFNIKKRRDELFFKPLMEKKPSCQAFGKKISLSKHPNEEILPGTSSINGESLLELLNSQSERVYVEKVALIYKFNIKPTIKLELARLSIAEKAYFSASIEGRSQNLVTLISKHLLNLEVSCDYVQFLKKGVSSR